MSIKTATLNGDATIEIARPEKKNAITGAMYQQMADALNAAKADGAVVPGGRCMKSSMSLPEVKMPG